MDSCFVFLRSFVLFFFCEFLLMLFFVYIAKSFSHLILFFLVLSKILYIEFSLIEFTFVKLPLHSK